ncbi:MAG: flavin reductase family protein [Lewinellaceae bacterium]|nr:flavin reductase family protein [Lewinellaceae bacterium]
MLVIDPKDIPTPEVHQYLLGAVSPRPIAFVSTVDENGRPNLAPYSFFNCFSSNPPIVVFSSNRRTGSNTTKDTLHNAEATGEVVINMVSHSIVRQMAVASVEYPPEVDEFVKAGFTPLPADLVRPFRVKESPVNLECKVRQIIPLGDKGGAGHLIVCEVIRFHIQEEVLDDKSRIDPHKIDLMGRMGRAFYVRASGEAVHTILQPTNIMAIGFDQLPSSARSSTILTGNDLGQLAGLAHQPTPEALTEIKENRWVQDALRERKPVEALHQLAKGELAKEHTELAAAIVWLADTLPADPAIS